MPDWRLDKLPKLYQQLIAQDKLLMNDGITKDELKMLEKLDLPLFSLCSQLSSYNIPETLSHCNFHDKNILVNIDTHKTTTIDLGEVAISHPFFSFHIVCTEQEKIFLSQIANIINYKKNALSIGLI